MFFCYRQAAKCYVYMVDIEELPNISMSKWWIRGWTLQELLAPKSLDFFSRHWKFLGTKAGLVNQVSAKSGIDAAALNGGAPLSSFSLVNRMSWAAHRKTTRIEAS